ncbi:MAG: hypothetical protein ACLF0G_13440 [Candidatus Brocadiia bacterium]
MARIYLLFAFDLADCAAPQSDDAAKRLARALAGHGAPGTFRLVGQRARLLRQRVRYDVIDALAGHALGYLGNWHGLRPQVAEYLAPLDWEDGMAEFERRERQGVDDLAAVLGRRPACYGPPGPNWAPQAFPVLRRWDIPVYLSSFGYFCLDAQPFYAGGLLHASHLAGTREDGAEARLQLELGPELGAPGALAEHKRAFARAVEALGEGGGLVVVSTRPDALVLERCPGAELKPRNVAQAGYRDFEDLLRHALGLPEAQAVDATQLPQLYPDLAQGRALCHDELLALARGVEGRLLWQGLDDVALSAAELFGLFGGFLAAMTDGELPPAAPVAYLDGPATRPEEADTGFAADWGSFLEAAGQAAGFAERHGRVPPHIQVAGKTVFPGDFLVTAAEAVATFLGTRREPERVTILPANNALEAYVDEAAARESWKSDMLPEGFAAPGLLELTRLQAWTLKPAIRKPR